MPAYSHLDYLMEDASLLTAINDDPDHIGRNLYTFNNGDEKLVLCHVPMFLPFARNDGEDLSEVEFGLSMSPAALLAINHWNNGNGVIVKDIEEMHKTCPIRLTTEILDTEASANKSFADFIDLVSRKVGSEKYLQPCALLGSIFSSVTSKFAILSGVYDVMSVSPGASSIILEDRKQYPLFARTCPSDGASGARAVQYFKQLGVKKFAVVYEDDAFGNAYNNVAKEKAAEFGMESLSIPFRTKSLTKETAHVALEEIKRKKINYMIGAFFSTPFEIIMETAFEIGIAGPGNLWLYCNELAYHIEFKSQSYERDSSLARAVFGNAVMVDKGSVSGDPANPSQYAAFLEEWQKLGNDTEALNYFASKQPRIKEGYQYQRELEAQLKGTPTPTSIYNYDAIVAIAISACKALKEKEDDLFSSTEHHNALLGIEFQSVSGNVSFAQDTISRNSESILYTMGNIIENQAISRDPSNVILQGRESLYFDIRSETWMPVDTSKPFIYSDGSTIQPPEYMPPWLSINIYLTILISALFLFIVILGYIGIHKIRKYTHPTVRVVATGEMPNMQLAENHTDHMFFSHVWKSGQAQTHAIVRKLQLYLPGIKVWLDVDELDNIYSLEESIETSAVFVLFYSPGYFESKNCRREIMAAIKFNKPIILLYEGSEAMLDNLRSEYVLNCLGDDEESPSSERILEKLLGEEYADNRILWLNQGRFSAASLNRIYSCFLKHLPYYQKNSFELRSGLAVPHEQIPVLIRKPIDLLVHKRKYNEDFQFEIQEIFSSYIEKGEINIIDTDNLPIKAERYESDEFHQNTSFYHRLKKQAGHRSLQKLKKHIMSLNARPSFFILYLNEDTFSGDDEENNLIDVLKYCFEEDVKIVLVHENDVYKGGCSFDEIYENAPSELLSPPFDLFAEIAIPFYSHTDYREVSIRLLMLKLGGDPIQSRSGKWSVVHKLSNPVQLSLKNFCTKRIYFPHRT